jgi:hypothetical protein
MASRHRRSGYTEGDALRHILIDQLSRYPLLDVQDLYKLVFQAALGSEHAVADVDAAQAWLARELKEMADGPPEPRIDPIAPDGRIVRVNLRPYLASNGDPAALLDAFVRTANEYRGTAEQLQRHWRYASALTESGVLPFALDAMQTFFEQMRARDFPAVHHSTRYEQAYHPAYRVVLRELLMSGNLPTPGSP